MKKIAVFVSGGGSNLQALIDNTIAGEIKGKICVVISSNKEAYALQRAQKYGIPAYIFNSKEHASIDDMYCKINDTLAECGVDLVVLAGYMSIIPQHFIEKYCNRIINVHPSLIPSFCGRGFYGDRVHSAVIEYGCKVSGATVHFVDSGVDSGAIIMQKVVDVAYNDTPQTLAAKVLKVEHEILPQCVALFCEDRLRIDGRKVTINPL